MRPRYPIGPYDKGVTSTPDSSNSEPPARGLSRDRHGRGIRGSLTGPHLPDPRSRVETFYVTVAHTAQYLRSLWPTELDGVHFDVANGPTRGIGDEAVPRWSIDRDRRRVVIFRLPIQRLSRLHRDDALHRQMAIEGCVFQAVAELIGKEPWELGPERFRH